MLGVYYQSCPGPSGGTRVRCRPVATVVFGITAYLHQCDLNWETQSKLPQNNLGADAQASVEDSKLRYRHLGPGGMAMTNRA